MARPSRTKPSDNSAQFLASLTESSVDETVDLLAGNAPIIKPSIAPERQQSLSVTDLLQGVVKPKNIDYDFIPDEAVFVLTEKKIDSCCTYKSRIEVTPLVCEICGLDFSRQLGCTYDELSDSDKLLVPSLMKKHMDTTHDLSSKSKITGAEYKKILRDGTRGNN